MKRTGMIICVKPDKPLLTAHWTGIERTRCACGIPWGRKELRSTKFSVLLGLW